MLKNQSLFYAHSTPKSNGNEFSMEARAISLRSLFEKSLSRDYSPIAQIDC